MELVGTVAGRDQSLRHRPVKWGRDLERILMSRNYRDHPTAGFDHSRVVSCCAKPFIGMHSHQNLAVEPLRRLDAAQSSPAAALR